MTRYLLDVYILRDEQARASMPQIMRAHMADSGASCGLRQRAADSARGLRRAQVLAVAHAREYEIEVVLILSREKFGAGDLSPLLAQCLDHNR